MAKKPGRMRAKELWQQGERRFAASMALGQAGRTEEACTGFAEAATLFRQAGDESAVAQCIYAMGAVYMGQDDAAQALELFTEALRLVESVGEQAGEAMCCESVAVAHYRLENYPAARQHFTRALVLYRMQEEYEGMATVLSGLGDCMLATNEFAAALDLYRSSLNHYIALGDRARMVDLNASIANASVALGDDKAAIRYLKTAQVIDKELGGLHAADIKTMLRKLGIQPEPKGKSQGKSQSKSQGH